MKTFEKNGKQIKVKEGFNFAYLLIGFLKPLIDGEFLIGIVLIALGFITFGFGAVVINLYMAFGGYAKMREKSLIDKGYKLV